MKALEIDWENPLIGREEVLDIRPSDLDDFYVNASDCDRTNLFFVLLNSFNRCMDETRRIEAAHLSFLIACYLFVPLTPPASQELAEHYIREAVSLNPCEEYVQWALRIKQGN